MKIIKDNEELKSYIVNGSIVFNESIKCYFDIHVDAHIKAHDIDTFDIDAYDIDAHNIYALNIDALNIKALNIDYYAFCISYGNIICPSINGRRNNSFHKCLDGKLTIKEQTKKIVIDGKEIELSLESFETLKKSLL